MKVTLADKSESEEYMKLRDDIESGAQKEWFWKQLWILRERDKYQIQAYNVASKILESNTYRGPMNFASIVN